MHAFVARDVSLLGAQLPDAPDLDVKKDTYCVVFAWF